VVICVLQWRANPGAAEAWTVAEYASMTPLLYAFAARGITARSA